MNKTHLHFVCWAFERIEPGSGNYLDNVIVEVFAESSAEALRKAESLVPHKPYYCVRSVIEHMEGACTNHAH